ncbi:oxygen-independent coproporphyrinogen III oxidase [Rhizobium sp. 9140]|uniref:oxygen-independent coproporphyrinogen III oxidase n=1 Tax=Rhizobium sp. 9140 TaxID=1761900 RepID=UPI0007918ABE|nr:oxygen-independent coproporphyrinogen III oxidase [Rhizobium sp. 9140]CZT36956.1 oxygen-independent coproporphyrinogen-3 oxidase [Rhizobium sp. 9140]
MSTDLLGRLARVQVPRYTSYPTAADFTPAVGPAEQASWLRQLPEEEEAVSVYLHVPYCREICYYCGCHAKAVRKEQPVEDYRRALEAEIALVATHLPARRKIARIAWGGGTPSILELAGLSSVIDVLKTHFDLEPGHEHAIELDPRVIDETFVEGLARLGVNRASLGVQDLDPDVQAAIGRVQPGETVAAAVRHLRNAGIGSINFDLIYGLPHQTEESLRATCHAVSALRPDRIAVYGYAHMPARRGNQRLIDAASLPDPEARLRQAGVVAQVFLDAGYVPIGIDHFARPDDSLAIAAGEKRLHRNFQGYTDDDRQTLLGFGCSSISRFSQGYVQSVTGIAPYKRAIADGRLPAARGHAFADEDCARADIIEALMCAFRVDLGSAARYADELALLRPYAAQGLIQMSSNVIAMTDKGRPFVRLIAAVFDSFRDAGPDGFSPSV